MFFKFEDKNTVAMFESELRMAIPSVETWCGEKEVFEAQMKETYRGPAEKTAHVKDL